jgi:hypothetical protein
MATNRELSAEIETLSAELGIEANVSGLNNAALTELVESLRAKAAERAPAPGPRAPEPVDGAAPLSEGGEPPPPRPVAQLFPYQVARGKSLRTKRGTLQAGEEVRARELSGGQEQLDQLVGYGYVDKRRA